MELGLPVIVQIESTEVMHVWKFTITVFCVSWTVAWKETEWKYGKTIKSCCGTEDKWEKMKAKPQGDETIK